jgi:hypothetical protein
VANPQGPIALQRGLQLNVSWGETAIFYRVYENDGQAQAAGVAEQGDRERTLDARASVPAIGAMPSAANPFGSATTSTPPFRARLRVFF